MRIWGWWRKDESKPTEPDSKPQMLEDLPPKFEDNVEDAVKTQERARPSLRRALKSISTDDFKSMPQMPCFRTAMLTGMGMGIVAGTVVLVARRSTSRAVNWMCGGFAVGSVVTWEQCRFRINRSKRNVQQAQEVWRHKGDEGETGKPEQ